MRRFHARRFWAVLLVWGLMVCCTTSALASYRTLSYGESGSEVRAMQQALKDKGYFNHTVDGVFGSNTRSAVRVFQAAEGLAVDGIPGNRTLSRLYGSSGSTATSSSGTKSSSSSGTLRYGSSGSRVKELQRALTSAGYYGGLIDGSYGVYTVDAVMDYQRDHYLYVDGVAGGETLTNLYNCGNAGIAVVPPASRENWEDWTSYPVYTGWNDPDYLVGSYSLIGSEWNDPYYLEGSYAPSSDSGSLYNAYSAELVDSGWLAEEIVDPAVSEFTDGPVSVFE